MERIRDRIDQLGGVIGQLAAAQATPRSHPKAATRFHAPGVADPAMQAAIAVTTNLSAQANTQLDALQRDMAEMKAMVLQVSRQAVPQGSNGEMAGDLRRIADGITRLQQTTPDPESHLDEVAAELHQMRQAILGMADDRHALDPQSLARSIEEGYAQIAARLETAMDRRPAADAGENRQMIQMAEHIAAMRDLVENLPLHIPVDAMSGRLDQIGEAISQLAGKGEYSLQKNFRQLEDRLDEVSRALVAVSVSPGGSDNDGIDRIEARLSQLARLFEGTIGSDHHGELADISGTAALDEINRQLQALSGRLDTSAPDAGYQDQWGPAILDRIDEISKHLAAKSGTPVEPGSTESLSNLILSELADLAARMDGFSHGGLTTTAVPDSAFGVIENQLAVLVDRIDQLAGAAAAQPFGDERLSSLEHTLGDIASRLQTVSSDGVDFSPLAERLDNIEQQVSISRDMAMDAAAQAAERAMQMAGHSAGQFSQSGPDPQLLEQLSREIQGLDQQARELAGRNADGLESIRQLLQAIGTRVEGIEADIREATASEPQSYRDDAANRGIDEPGPAEHYARSPDQAAMNSGNPVAARFDRAGDTAAVSWPHADETGLPPGMAQVNAPEVEDIPLEPGSGVPDLAALVRDASQRRRAGAAAESERSEGPQDFMAAARRAAQMAAQQSASASLAAKPHAMAKVKSAIAVPSFIAGNRKLLIAAAAVVLILAAAVPLVTRYFAGEAQVVDMQSGVVPQSSDAEAKTKIAGGAEPSAALPQATLAQTPVVKPVEDPAGEPEAKASLEANPSTSAPAAAPQIAADQVAASPAAAPDTALADIPEVPQDTGNPVLRDAASAGDPSALFEIARRYTDGEGVDRDLAKAAIWYEASARSGSAPAQYRYANFLEKGHGVALDVEKAAVWYQRAAEQGNALAMHNLAVIHTSGLIGGKPDMDSALGWFHKAAELGVKDSQVNLGIIYAKGLGVETDLVIAYKWLSVAARGGDSDAASKRDTLAAAMRPEQLEKARAESELWKPGALDPIANVAVVLPEWKNGAGQSAATPAPSQSPATQATREMVAKVQALLAGKGYDPGPADGQIGARTRDAVKAFQKKAGMPVNGEITGELLEKLASNAA